MGMEVDSLEISIQSTFDSVSKSIDGVIGKLDKLEKSLNIDVNIQGIEKASQSLDSVTSKIKNLTKSMSPEIQKFSGTISRIMNAGSKSTASADSLPKIGKAMTELTNSMSGIKSVESSVNRFVSSIARIANAGDKSVTVTKELPALGKSLKNVADDMAKLGNIPDSVNSFTQAIAQLANAGDRAEKTAAGLGTLADKTLDFFNVMKNAPQISENTIRMTQAMSQLSSKSGKLGVSVSSSLEPIKNAFSSLGDVAKTALSKLKKVISGIAPAIKGAFSGIGKIGLSTANILKKVATSMQSSFSKISSSGKQLGTVALNLKNILKTAAGFGGLYGLINFGKNAINFGSDITEVENVVNTAFGSMAKQAYDFASTAKEQFGLSELAAKQYSGTMMAMLKSSGVAQSEAAKMSTTIAGLAGDIASFYNIETDEAFYKLRSAISGETEPMKALGINMNIVNLEAFAMSKGINKAYKEMSLAEQTTLRYNYLLAKTTDAQGDFAKTAGTYANQWRLLKLNIQSVSAVIGQGLIAAVLPAIKAINALMSKVMEAAKVFKSFMYTLTGFQPDNSVSGIVNDMAGIGDVSDGLENIGDAAEEAGKKIKQKLLVLPFDELNILTDASEDIDDSLSDIGDLDLGLGDLGDFELADTTPINEWAKKLRELFLSEDWEGLGKTIAELLNAGLKKVYDTIIDITPKVEQALKNFAKVFNSFVEYFDWELLGRTIGAGINLLTKAFNALFGDEGIDLENLGRKLSVGFRGMVDEIEWKELGNALGNGFMIAWRIADGFIQDMWRIDPDTMLTGWEELGIGIGEAVNGIFERIDFEQIARVITDGFRGILETLATALETIDFTFIADKINAGLEALYNGLKWDNGMGDTITRFTSAVSNAFNDLLNIDFGTIGSIVGSGITNIVRAFNQLTDPEGGLNFEQLGQNIADSLRNLFSNIPWEEFGNALGNGFMVAWRILDGFLDNMAQTDGAGLTGWAQLGISIGNAINGIFQKIDFSVIAQVIVNGFNGIIEALRNFIDTVNWEDLSNNLTNGLNTLVNGIDWKGAGETLSNLVIELLGVFQRVANDFDWKGFGRSVGEFLSSIDWMTIIGQVFDILWTVFSGFISGLFDTKTGKVVVGIAAGMLAIEGVFKGLKLIGTVTTLVKTISTIFSGLSLIFSPSGAVIVAIVAGAALIIANWDKIKDAVKALWDNVLVPFGNFLKDIFVSIWDDMLKPVLVYIAENVIPKLMETLRNLWDNVLQPLGSFILDVFAPVFEVLSGVLESLWKNVVIPVADAIGGLFASAFKALWAIINDLIIPVFKSVIDVLKILWEKLMKPIVEWVRDTLGPILEQVFEAVGNKIGGLIDTLSNVLEFLSGLISGVGDTLSSVIDMIGEVLGNLFDIFGGIIDIITGVFTGDWEKAWNGVVEVFRGIFNLIPSIAEGVINGAIGLINGIINGINNVTDKVGIPDIPNIPEVKLPRFEMGGFPEDGLFFANHNELVGTFSNGQTAVANNEQIVEGIKQGVKEAVSEILAPYLEDIAQNTRETAQKEMSVNLDGRELVTFTDERRARNGYAF